MNLELSWKLYTEKYSSGYHLYIGRWKVGSRYFDSARNKEDPNKWAAYCALPGMKMLIGHYATEEEAKKIAEKAAEHWIAGLSSK